MNLENLNNYINEQTLIIDNFESYPMILKNFILENSDLISSIKKEYKDYLEFQRKTNYYSRTFNSNNLSLLNMKIVSLINKNNLKLLVFHVSRLTNEDCLLIKDNFQELNKELMLNRIESLSKYSIREQDIELIKSCLDERYLENKKLGAFTNLSSLKNDLYNEFYENWGGEIISRKLIKTNIELMNKINSISTPYLLIFRYRYEEQKIKDLVLDFIKNEDINKIEDKWVYLDNTNCELLDMIKI